MVRRPVGLCFFRAIRGEGKMRHPGLELILLAALTRQRKRTSDMSIFRRKFSYMAFRTLQRNSPWHATKERCFGGRLHVAAHLAGQASDRLAHAPLAAVAVSAASLSGTTRAQRPVDLRKCRMTNFPTLGHRSSSSQRTTARSRMRRSAQVSLELAFVYL